MKKRVVFVIGFLFFIIFSFGVIKSNALSLRSISINELVKKTQFAGWSTIVKADMTSGRRILTFKIGQVLRGPRMKTVKIEVNRMYGPTNIPLGSWVFLALRKDSRGNWRPVAHRGIWIVNYILRSNMKGFYALRVPQGLIYGIPKRLHKLEEIFHILPNGKYHKLKMRFYHYFEMMKYLRRIF